MLLLVLGVVLVYVGSQLPDVMTLKTVQLQVPLRIYTIDEKLIAEFGEKRRMPVAFEQLPPLLIKAVLATEDQRFYAHAGIDFYGLLRAAKHLLETGKKGQGGSTITMQVARNFFLTRQKTYSRKIRELLLAVKIDRELSKNKILELYFNKIFFGHRAYGIGAAAHVYYGKKLAQLSLPQIAMLAGLPKAPSTLNPLANPDAAIERRNHVLARMFELGYIDNESYQDALHTPVTAQYHHLRIEFEAPYAAEMARNRLLDKIGEDIYTQGLTVYTTVDSRMQKAATQAVHKGLLAYEKRHGYRGAEKHIVLPEGEDASYWLTQLDEFSVVHDLVPVIVAAVDDQNIEVLFVDGHQQTITWEGLRWARRQKDNMGWSPAPKHAHDIVQVGDVIRLRQDDKGQWSLSQLPEVEGALVSLAPDSGAIQALVGGFSYARSNFNRVEQAKRQPGSCFKPFVYAAALAQDYTLATLINDAPVVLHDTGDDTLWRPQNDTRRFYGPTRLRIGLIRSRNLVSIRLLQNIGIPYTREYLQRFGFQLDDMPDSLSLALGSGSVTPLDLAQGFAVFANGGYVLQPYLLDRIIDVHGDEVYHAQPKRIMTQDAGGEVVLADNADNNTQAEQSVPADITYLMSSALEDAIQHGTGRAARVLGRRDIAGKTGTTNDQVDAWFAGFNRDLVTIAWVGFDQPRSLHEYGAQAALPIWIDFMRVGLKGKPQRQLQRPSNIVTARIDPKTGLLASTGQKKALFESFRRKLVPIHQAPQAHIHADVEHTEAVEPLF